MDKPRLKSNDSGALIEITQTPFVIGRSLGCDYIIGNEVISRKHCSLEKRTDSDWFIKDFSRNGIYINGNAVRTEQILKHNDIISLSPEGNDYTFSLYSTTIDPSSSVSQPAVNSVDGNTNSPSPNNTLDNVTELLNCDAELEAVLAALPSVPPSPMSMSSNDPTKLSTEVSLPSTSAVRKSTTDDETVCKKTKIMDKASEEVPSRNETDLMENCDNEASNEVQNTNAASTSTKDEAKDSQTKVFTPQYNLEEMEDEMQCSICSEMFIKATTLNCSHTFCKYCIETWKKTKNICPICRAKITTLNATIVLDNVIEKVLQIAPEDVKDRRKSVIAERIKLEEDKVSTSNNGRGRGRRVNSGRRGNRGNNRGNRGQTNQDRPRIVIGPFPNIRIASSEQHAVISVDTSESESSSLSSNSTIGSDIDTEPEWREDETDWEEPGIPGAYYGGYGHCYSCGRRGHWANGCPYT